jgi:hypothetical protein
MSKSSFNTWSFVATLAIVGSPGCAETVVTGSLSRPEVQTDVLSRAGSGGKIEVDVPNRGTGTLTVGANDSVVLLPPKPVSSGFPRGSATPQERPGETLRLQNADITQVRIKKHGRGAAEGAAIGALGGAALGALAGWAVYEPCRPKTLFDNSWCIDFGPGVSAEAGAFLLGVTGALSGALYGAIVGHRTTYVFRPTGGDAPHE